MLARDRSAIAAEEIRALTYEAHPLDEPTPAATYQRQTIRADARNRSEETLRNASHSAAH